MLIAERFTLLLLFIFLFIVTYLKIENSKKGKPPSIRRIPGIDVIEEAVGRSVELGKGIHFTTGGGGGGLTTSRAPAHLSGLYILDYVANRSAEFGVPLIFSTPYADIIPVAEDYMKQACTIHGQTFDISRVRFYPDSSYRMGVMGTLARENIGTNFMMGWFWSEALNIAEVGAQMGCIQIAGCPDDSSIPFLIAACDYVLISEELIVAGAYLSKDPAMLGSVGGSDFAKLVAIFLIIIGTILTSLNVEWFINFMGI